MCLTISSRDSSGREIAAKGPEAERAEAEGAEAEVKAFTAAVEDRMHGYVRKAERSHGLRAGQFSGFKIV